VFAAGGPLMNVIDIGKYTDKVLCAWRGDNNETNYYPFDRKCLRHAVSTDYGAGIL
jgi:hypothetical protein